MKKVVLAAAGAGAMIAAPVTAAFAAGAAGDPGLGLGDENVAIAELQKDLSDFGYGVEATSTYGRGTEIVVEAFQRHYRPERVDGRADRSTRETLKRLLLVRAGAAV